MQVCLEILSKWNGIYSQNRWNNNEHKNLPKTNDGVYVINLNEYKYIETHWVASYLNGSEVIYLDSFIAEHIPIEIKNFIGNENITTNTFRIQAYDSIMSGYFCIGFIDFIFKGKNVTDLLLVINLFSPNNFKNNNSLTIFLTKINVDMKWFIRSLITTNENLTMKTQLCTHS